MLPTTVHAKMTSLTDVRPSRDGDQFHYTWAARQALRLLDTTTGLTALYVEAVDPSEHRTKAEPDRGNSVALLASDGSSPGTGDEVIDLAEYWGSNDIDDANQVIYRQFKHSTTRPDEPWTSSYLTKTLVGFARKYRSHRTNHPEVLPRIRFEFITNRPVSDSALTTINDLRKGKQSTAADLIRQKLADILAADDIVHLANALDVDLQAPTLLKLRHLLETQIAGLLPGAPGDQALLLKEMISSRATSVSGNQPAVYREDVLAALKTSDDQLLPAPNLIQTPASALTRCQFTQIADSVCGAEGMPVVIHGPGGVGKSVLSMALLELGPAGSETLVYDCFGNGSYRRPSAARHQAKQGLVQLSNELSARTLCDPLVPSATADDTDYARAFLRRLDNAARTIATKSPHALLTIVIDAADNAAMMSADEGDRPFVTGLLREELPPNVRLVVTCRTERRDRLELPPQHLDVRLEGFDLVETRAHVDQAFPGVSAADAAEFHARTSHNPRVQATVLEATSTIQEALDWLAPNPVSAAAALDSIIERQIAEVRDSHHSSAAEIDQICIGLAALRPMIPVRVLAELSGIDESLVLSFVTDLGRPLLIDSGTVQFRDEPTETWFRNHYRPTGAKLDEFLVRLTPLADGDAYVAASLPALLFEANRFNELVQLALSDRALPDNTLPPDQRNELQRREISQQRTKFALSAALRGDHDFAATQLALRLGELTAGRTRRLKLIRDNTDFAARFLDAHVLEQLVATRAVMGKWPSSNLLYEGALLAGAPGQSDQARNRLRSAVTWVRAWTQQAARNDKGSNVSDKDVMQIAWGLLNTDGPSACIDYLLRWTPRTLAFDVGVLVARRLADAGRETDLESLALSARGKHTKFAIAQVCAERNLVMTPEVVMHLLKPALKRSKPVRPSRRADEPWASPMNELVHEGLTAIVWLLTRALATRSISRDETLRVLNVYLPANMGHRTGEWHHRDLWSPILGFALRASLEGRELTATEIEGPVITKARERQRSESSRSLRAYEANVEPLVGWANLWTALQLDPSPTLLSEFSDKARTFLSRESRHRYNDEETDQIQLNIAASVILSVLAEHPATLTSTDVTAFCERNRDSLWRSTMILLVQRASASDNLGGVTAELARQVHTDLLVAREDAHEKAKDLVLLARATYQASQHEAEIHFQAALDIANAIGDDAWSRFDAFLDIAKLAGETSGDEPGRAYRMGQISESLEEYLGDSLDYARVARVAAGLSVPEALAQASRWRDRRVAPITRLAEPFCTEPVRLLAEEPALALALLPFCDRHPAIDALAEALKSSALPATPAIVALLRLWRAERPKRDALDRALDVLGVSKSTIEDIDPTLLTHREAAETTDVPGTEVSHAPTSYMDLDFTTVEGWVAALDRAQRRFDLDALFDHLASVGYSAPVLAAFGNCPTVDVWHLSAILERLETVSLSMGAQGALDVALTALLGRLGSNYLLVSYRSLDVARLRALTGHDTDYGLVASRAAAEQSSFEPEEAFTLAAKLTSRLTSADRLSIFDAAASLFSDTAPTDSFDGKHPTGMTENCDDVTAVACLIWTALGDPAPATRWLAAHAVHLLLSIEAPRLAERLCEVAMGSFDPTVFRDRRLPFYDKHATQWLVFALSRASLEAHSLHRVSKFAPLLRQVLEGPRHAVTSPLAREVVLRLQRAGMIPAEMDWPSPLESIGRPIEVLRRSWRSGGHVVRSFSELNDLAQSDAGNRTLDDHADDREAEDNLDDVEPGEGEVEDTFRFFFDFRAYWCEPLARAFGLTDTSIEKLVNEVLIDRWQVKSRGQAEDDPRHELRLYPRNTYSQKSEWPPEEDLDFYLAVQGLYEVAGSLLQLLPVGQTYDEDEETGETEYSRFLSHHVPTRADGRWLSDRADAVPLRAEAFGGSGAVGGSRTYEATWPFEVNATMFWDELQPEPDRLSISAHRSVQEYSRHETVQVTSALVAPATARSLLRATQTAPDTHAFRLPDASDHEFTSEVAGFELTGWIEEHGYAEGLDSRDPLASGMHYPPQRPSTVLPALAELSPDADMRIWRDENEHIVFISRVWDDSDGGTSSHGSAGHQLLIDRPRLSALLQRLNRWLIVEVQIRRYVDSSAHRAYDIGRNDDEQVPYLEPYTKYFLVDLAGGIHDQ
ncbi:ATP-binding protein [Kocuria carniphila]|uniref:ATP-binding protein n=1 Tax=Kocuria carniphila TaxID=262208 RepID=UPI0028EAA648|nr:ATP-binding protein [Kocuria carniphila]